METFLLYIVYCNLLGQLIVFLHIIVHRYLNCMVTYKQGQTCACTSDREYSSSSPPILQKATDKNSTKRSRYFQPTDQRPFVLSVGLRCV